MRYENIIVAMPLEEELLNPLYDWGKRFDWSEVQSVHFVHIVKKNITPLEFGLMEMPDENAYQEMVPTIEKFLKDEARKFVPPNLLNKASFHVSADFHPEDKIVEFINFLKADLIVVATRGRHGFNGLFHSSFTDHMVKFAPCDVFVVRPVHEEPEASSPSP